MGSKTSKQQNYHSSTQNPKSYKTVRRAYPELEHHSSPVSHDVLRFASQENRNLIKHNQLSPNSPNQFPPNSPNRFSTNSRNQFPPNSPNRFSTNSSNQLSPNSPNQFSPNSSNQFFPNSPNSPNQFSPNSSNQFFPNSPNSPNQLSSNSLNQQKIIQPYPLPTKKFRNDQNRHGNKLSIKKSHSMEHLSNPKKLITAQEVIKNQSERRKKYQSSSSLRSNDFLQDQTIQKSSSSTRTSTNQFIYSKNKKIQIPSDLHFVLINQFDLQNSQEIGKGNFGTVYRALYKGTRDVALKTLNSRRRDSPNVVKSSIEEYDDKSLYELLHEAHIMTCLQHANVLRIIGITFFGNDKQLSLVTDFMRNGSLLDYLRKHRDIFVRSDSKDVTFKLNSFAKQIFEAMLYLEERSVIHRDLAARNCLIGEEDTLKVGDFGLTKLTEFGLYKGTNGTICAVRWTSPEALFYSKYTSRSDVWSYGITLWEIYSLGEKPYGNIDNKHLRYILKNSSENLSRYLPQSHQFGSDEIYTHLILPCLTYNVALRPRFKDFVERIINILDKKVLFN